MTLPYHLLSLFGKHGNVLALEPNKYVFRILEKNASLNTGKTSIIPLMAAATDHDGEFEFEYSDAGFCNGGRHEGISKWKHGHAFKLKVKGINLERFLRKQHRDKLQKLKFIKIDAEGYDLSVLKSLQEIITEFKPYLQVEIFKDTSVKYRNDMYSLLSDLNYSVYKVNSDQDLQGPPVNPDDLMTWKHYDIFCIPKPAN